MKTGRHKISGLTRANITITKRDRVFLEKLGGSGLVAGIRRAVELLRGKDGR